MEKAAARVCREAGARVSENTFLRDLNLDGIRPDDGRRLEVIANGLPIYGGMQLAIDTTLVSPVRGDGTARPRAAYVDGAAIAHAEADKASTYPEFSTSTRCKLIVLAFEVGGRWSQQAVDFVWALAKSKAATVPPLLRRAAEQAYFHRWTGMLAFAAGNAFAASLLEEPLDGTYNINGEEPDVLDVLADARLIEGPEISRMR